MAGDSRQDLKQRLAGGKLQQLHAQGQAFQTVAQIAQRQAGLVPGAVDGDQAEAASLGNWCNQMLKFPCRPSST